MRIIPKYMYYKGTEIPRNPLALKSKLYALKVDYGKRIDKMITSPTFDLIAFNRLKRTYTRISKAYERGSLGKGNAIWKMLNRQQTGYKAYKTDSRLVLGNNFSIPIYKKTYSLIETYGGGKRGLAVLNTITEGKTKKEILDYIQP